MVRNQGKGGKNWKKSKKNSENTEKRQLEFKEEQQEYALIVKMLGNSRCECLCSDGRTRLGHIRGSMKKRVWIVKDDIVLLSLRDFQDDKADIIHKYTHEEVKILRQYGEIVGLNNNEEISEDILEDNGFEFNSTKLDETKEEIIDDDMFNDI
tara:strand:+ start:373 stop:831 length:459 start_codon:yes stop_codon:yes gene_type:complete